METPGAAAHSSLAPKLQRNPTDGEGVAWRVRTLSRLRHLVLAGALIAPAISASAEGPNPPAFPGAMGFGATATGGRGGEVVRVTTLNRSGEGSLAWALQEVEGPRIVVFDVGGVIKLREEIEVKGSVTILGQTAPGDGITVEGARLVITGDNVIIRGMRLRPGDGKGQSRSVRDGISIGAKGKTVRRVILDHNSITWATDENVATWYTVEEVTISNNIIAEALLNAGHSQGRHSMGLLVGEDTRHISILRNAFVSNFWRNPQIDSSEGIEVVNNLIYNYGPGGIQVSGGPSQVDIIGNMLLAGPDTPDVDKRPAIDLEENSSRTIYYLKDNVTPLGPNVASGSGKTLLSDIPVVGKLSGTPVLQSGAVQSFVTSRAGARIPQLDRVDERILESVKENSGRVRDNDWHGRKWRPDEARWPKSRDRDKDGLPDNLEAKLGTDPEVADSATIDPASGYAFIEIYANGLLGHYGQDP